MKKLNNKGITIVELIISFTLLMVIAIGMLNVVNEIRSLANQKLEEKKVTEFNDGAAVINLLALDTQELEVKKYFYDIQVNTKDGRVDTVIAPSKFVVMEGISYEW